jgi:hypothetical protein
MLSQDRFMGIIGYLSAYYTNFKFELKDDGEPSYQFNVWYDVFKDFDEERLVEAVKSYCRSNVFAPNSPTQILEYIRKKLIESQPTADNAWEIAYGSSGVIKTCNFNIDRAIKELKKQGYHIIALTVNEMRSQFIGVLTENVPYLKRDFAELYKDLLVRETSNCVAQNRLGFDEVKKIGKEE